MQLMRGNIHFLRYLTSILNCASLVEYIQLMSDVNEEMDVEIDEEMDEGEKLLQIIEELEDAVITQDEELIDKNKEIQCLLTELKQAKLQIVKMAELMRDKEVAAHHNIDIIIRNHVQDKDVVIQNLLLENQYLKQEIFDKEKDYENKLRFHSIENVSISPNQNDASNEDRITSTRVIQRRSLSSATSSSSTPLNPKCAASSTETFTFVPKGISNEDLKEKLILAKRVKTVRGRSSREAWGDASGDDRTEDTEIKAPYGKMSSSSSYRAHDTNRRITSRRGYDVDSAEKALNDDNDETHFFS
jgi:hypothetical protein